jgi:hypothetical protein
MYIKIRRRRFGQLLMASAATSVLANFSTKSFAQVSQPIQPIIIGLSLSAVNQGFQGGITNSTNRVTDSINARTDFLGVDNVTSELDEIINTTLAISVRPLRITSSGQIIPNGQMLTPRRQTNATAANQLTAEIPPTKVENANTPTEAATKALYTQPFERLTGASFLNPTTLVTTAVATTRLGDVTRLIKTNISAANRPSQSLKVSGFRERNNTIENILAINDNQLLAIVSRNEGSPPFELALIDPMTGILDYELDLPSLLSKLRFSNLCLSPDGRIYATALGAGDGLTLVEINPNDRSIITVQGWVIPQIPLSYNNQPVQNDLLSLAFSPFGELYALGNPDYEKTNSLFSVDINSGKLQKLIEFPVEKIAIPS